MARKPRKESSSQKYHIILRGNNKQLLFYDEKDCDFFLKRVFKYADQLEVKIYSYCLMGNHVHILLGNAPKETLSLFVQKLANSYVYYFNHKYDCSGHLFQGRFKSEPIEDDVYLKNVLRYIHKNPQNAGLCKINEYKWSSYKQITELKGKALIDRDFVIELFGSIKCFEHFMYVSDDKQYMEYENRIFYSDTKAVQYIRELIGKSYISQIKNMSQKDQRDLIRKIKERPFSISQICRITGLPRKIIKEA